MTTNWQQSAQNLIQAARDLRVEQPPAPPSRPLAGSAYERLHTQYVRDLGHAHKWALSWWQSVIDTAAARMGDRAQAERSVAARFAGPAAHAAPVYVLRKYWLECAALGETLAPEERVHPEDFLLSSLLGAQPELAKFVSGLPYWPIGMDEQQRWV